MTVRFADTHYFLALLDSAEEAHDRANEFTRGLADPIVTTQWVLSELAGALAQPPYRGEFVRLFGLLKSDSNVTIIPANAALFDAGMSLYIERPDKGWSLVDCISFVVMRQRRIREALTADHHFEQAGFVALLK